MNRLAVVIVSALSVAARVADAQQLDTTASSSAPSSGSSSTPVMVPLVDAEPSSSPPPLAPATIAPIAIAPDRISFPSHGGPVARGGVRIEIVSPSVPQTIEVIPRQRPRPPGPPVSISCTTPCSLTLDPIEFRFTSQVTGGPRGGGRFDAGRGPMRLTLHRPHGTLGVGFAMAGGVLSAVSGFVLLSVGAFNGCFLNPCPPVDREALLLGGLSLLVVGGVIAGVAGWGISRSHSVVDREEPIVVDDIPPIRVLPASAPASTAPSAPLPPPPSTPTEPPLRMAPM